MCAIIRTSARSMSLKAPIVALREGADRLCVSGHLSKSPKWVPLEPGVHELRFSVTRASGSGTYFRRSVNLEPGEVLVAVCEPVQPPVFYARGPSQDVWFLGVTAAGRGQAQFRVLPGEPAGGTAEPAGTVPLPRPRTRRRAKA